jgi:hypothetical protein
MMYMTIIRVGLGCSGSEVDSNEMNGEIESNDRMMVSSLSNDGWMQQYAAAFFSPIVDSLILQYATRLAYTHIYSPSP